MTSHLEHQTIRSLVIGQHADEVGRVSGRHVGGKGAEDVTVVNVRHRDHTHCDEVAGLKSDRHKNSNPASRENLNFCILDDTPRGLHMLDM